MCPRARLWQSEILQVRQQTGWAFFAGTEDGPKASPLEVFGLLSGTDPGLRPSLQRKGSRALQGLLVCIPQMSNTLARLESSPIGPNTVNPHNEYITTFIAPSHWLVHGGGLCLIGWCDPFLRQKNTKPICIFLSQLSSKELRAEETQGRICPEHLFLLEGNPTSRVQFLRKDLQGQTRCDPEKFQFWKG